MKVNFASDNYAGLSPELLRAMEDANGAPEPSYGTDSFTLKLEARFRQEFGDGARTFPVFNGTGANVVSLGAVLRPYETVLCAEKSHIAVDECGAPEQLNGVKLELIPSGDQKITVDGIRKKLVRRGDIHYSQARVVSITNSTEYGTVYTPEEIRKIADFCRAEGLYLHCDGSRISNAAAALKTSFRALTTDAGVDFLSFGATKIGGFAVEAVVFLNAKLGEDFGFHRKQKLQLSSKMRFASAQLLRLFEGELWRTNGERANGMAARLEAGLRAVPGFQLTQAREANAVFAILPPAAITALQKEFSFYVWDEHTHEVRLMTSFQTTEAEVDAFVAACRRAIS